MTEAKFTEGPWHIDSFGFVVSEYGDFVITPTNEESIAFNTKHDESLVLSAPRLYRTLEYALEAIENDGIPITVKELEEFAAPIREALAIARRVD